MNTTMSKQLAVLRVTALTAALMSVYGVAQGTPTYSAGSGDTINVTDSTITNTDSPATSVIIANGLGADITFDKTDIVINWNGPNASNTSNAALQAANGGKITITGGTINTSYNNDATQNNVRKQGLQAIDGGTINASNITINTTGGKSPGVQAFRTYTNPTAGDTPTVVNLDHVAINTGGPEYSVGIRADHNGASVIGVNTDITTTAKKSFGVEVDDGGAVQLTNGTITTSGDQAAGVRAYTGTSTETDPRGQFGPGIVTLTGTTIKTSGAKAAGLLAGDADEPTAGIINATNVTITTSGSGAHAAAATNGSSITLSGGTLTAEGSGYGLYVAGAGSSITVTNGTVIQTDGGKYAVQAVDGGQVSLSGGSVTNAGTTSDRTTVYATGVGTSVTAQDVALKNTAAGLGTGDLSNVVSAASQASVTLNGGSVSSESSTFGRGILASSGASVTANGVDISTVGTLSNAVHAYSKQQLLTDTADTAFITLDSGTVGTSGDNSYGLFAQNKGSSVSTTGSTVVTTTGANSFGAVAYNGGVLNLAGVALTTSGSGADGIAVNELLGAQTPGKVPTPNFGSTLSLKDSSVTSEKANGIYLGKDSTATIENTAILAAKHGVVIQDGASAAITGGSVASTGNEQHAVVVDGEGSSFSAGNVAISAAGSIDNRGDVTHAIDLTNGATATITGGSIKTTGANFTTGIFAATGSTATANNVAISTTGDTGVGVRAYSAYETADESPTPTPSQTVNINGGSITTSGVESYGLWAQDMGSHIVADSYTDPSSSSVTPLTITTSGENAYGVAVYGGADASLTDVVVNTSGAGASGVALNTLGALYHPTRPSSVAATFTMSGGSISATGAGASAAVLQDSGTASFTGTTLSSAGATFSSVFTQSGQSQNITLGSGATVASNNGTLLNVTRSGAGTDGTVMLALQDGSFAQGNVYDKDGSNQVTVTKGANASWAGLVVDSTTQQIDSSTPPPPDYSTPNDVLITSTDPVTFTGTTNVGGDFSGATGGSTTFSGSTTISGNLVGAQGSTTSFSGPTTLGAVTGGSGSSIHFTGSSTNIQGNVSGNQGTQITFSQGGSTTIGGSVSLSGSGTSTHGGTIDNPIIVQGDVTVGSGATLGGNITSNGALGGSGGTVGPGNSVGVQSYATSAGFTGTYKAEVNAAGNSDLIIIRTGNFDLSGIGLSVGQENGNGGYVLNHDYTIVQTPGGSVVNTFQSTGLDSSFAGTLVQLDPVKYGAQDVKVSLSVNNSAVDAKRAGFSANQNATLDGVLSVAGRNTAADAALQSTDSGGALNQLSGESFASTASALLASSGLVQRTLTQRMQGNVGSGMRPGALTAQAGGALPAGSLPQSEAQPLWAQVVGNWNTLSSDGNAAKVSTDLGGVFVGGDAGVGSGWRVGGALGYTHGNIDVDDRSSRSKVDSYTVSLYGGNSWAAGKGKVNFLAGAAYTWNKVDSRRTVTVGGNQTLRADYNGNATQVFTELGYALPVGAHSVLEPYAGLAWWNQHTQGFSESGGAAALSGQSQTDSVTTFTLGLRGKTQLAWGADKRVTLFGGLGWRHASGDTTPDRKLAFIQGGGATFRVAGAPIARNAAVVDAGLEASVGRMTSMGLSYSGQYGDGNTDHAGMLYVKTRF